MARRRSVTRPHYVDILGKRVQVANIYPPFYPDEIVRWKPAPDPNSARYAAWGRRHYGKEWYRLRKSMLEERNVYVPDDYRYKKRQAELRRIENAVEGRSFPGGMRGAVWQGVWQKICGGRSYLSPTASPPHSASSSELAKSNATPSPSPEPPSPSEFPCDEAQQWTTEERSYNECLLKTSLVADERSRHEDAIGDRQRESTQEEVRVHRQLIAEWPLPRNSVAYERIYDEFSRLDERFRNLVRGMPLEKAERLFQDGKKAADAYAMAVDRLVRDNPVTEKQLMEKLMHWQKYELTIDEHDRLTRLYGFTPVQRPDYAAEPRKYNGYDYLSMCKWSPKSRQPPPNQEDMRNLVRAWSEGQVLNEREINELLVMYGFCPGEQAPPPPQQRRRSPPRSVCRRELASLRQSAYTDLCADQSHVVLRSGTTY